MTIGDTTTGESMKRAHLLRAAVLAAVLLAVIAWRTVPMRPGHRTFAKPIDHHKYIYMSEHGVGEFHVAPFCWRIGGPFLAGLWPFEPWTRFAIVTLAALWGTGVAIYALARAAGFDDTLSLGAMFAFFSLGWAVHYHVFNVFVPDPLCLLGVVLSLRAAVRGRPVAFAVWLALAAACKESALFFAPLYLTLAPQRAWNLHFISRVALAMLPAAAVLVAIRVAIPACNDDPAYLGTFSDLQRTVYRGQSSYDYLDVAADVLAARRAQWQTVIQVRALSVGAFGVFLPLMLLFALRRHADVVLRGLPAILLAYVQLIFATDTQRLLIIACPAMILIALYGMREVVRLGWAGPIQVATLPLILIMLNLMAPLRIGAPTRWQAVACAAYAAGTWATARIRHRAPPQRPED